MVAITTPGAQMHVLNHVGGQWVGAASGDQLEVRNPATAAVIAAVPNASASDVDDAVRAASEAGAGAWARVDVHQRAVLLGRLADLIDDRLPDLFALETRNNGRPIRETRAQVGNVGKVFRYNAALALAAEGQTFDAGPEHLCYLERWPLGVCAVITPFNHPLSILARGVAPALAAGNTVVVKPSELTPLSSLELASMVQQAGFPDGVVNVVVGGPDAGRALVEHPEVAKVDFTGGHAAGVAVSLAAAKRLVPSTTELGGKSPVLVFADAGVERAVKGVALGGFVASGQTCICGSRVLVEASIYDEFVEALAALADRIEVSDPLLESTHMGPLISAGALERTERYVALGREEGATVAAGGYRPVMRGALDSGYFYRPTVLRDVTNSMRCAQEEIFGPVVGVIPFQDEEEAVRLANDIEFGLGAAVWTSDVARAHRVANRLQAGLVWINDHHRKSVAMPWGGLKQSGVGKQAGRQAFEQFSNSRSVVVRTADSDADWFGIDSEARLY